MAMAKAKIETVTLETFDIACYDLGGPLGVLIARLEAIKDAAEKRGLTNIRVGTDYVEEGVYERGGYQGNFEKKWTVKITADKPPTE